MAPIRIILVEDHELTRIGLRTTLNQQPDVEVVGEAKEAKTALQLLQSLRPDVAIVDVGLPGMSGIELIQQFKQLQQEDTSLTTKIVIMTMQDTEDTVLAAFAAGANSYCVKDASVEKLLEAIHTTAEGHSYIDPAIAQFILHRARSTYGDAHGNKNTSKVQIRGLSAEEEELIFSDLTERELEVLQLIVEGCSNEQIGAKLYITVGTVKTHVRNVLHKMSVDDRTQAAVRALRAGLVN